MSVANKRYSQKVICAIVSVAMALFCFAAPALAYAATNGLKAGGIELSELSGQSLKSVSTQEVDGMSKFGIDVSQWQFNIDWPTVATQVDYAIIRCGYGSNIKSQDDKYWLANASGCQAAGIPMGVYLYSYATTTSMAKSEAKHVIRCMKNAGLSAANLRLPIYLDIEEYDQRTLPSTDLKKIFNAFKKTLNNAGYNSVGIYASASVWEDRLNALGLSKELRWVAHYGTATPANGFPVTAAAGMGIWQYTSSAKVSGISQRVDGNYALDKLSFLVNNRDTSKPKLFRMYNPRSGEHFYTLDSVERNVLETQGWSYEGVVSKTPKSSKTPVYRLCNLATNAHLFTTDNNERTILAASGAWIDEGIAFYSDDAKGTPVYRLYNPWFSPHDHHYTSSVTERDILATQQAWSKEGVGWYGLAS